MLGVKIKLYLLVVFCCIAAWANAVPSIGTTALLYGNNNASDVLISQLDDTKIKDPAAKLGIRRVVLSEIVKQMVGFQALLDETLTESGSYDVYDAKPVVQNLRSTNSQLIDTIYKTTSVAIENNENMSQHKSESANPLNKSAAVVNNDITPSSNKFILLGFVDSIREKENRTPIQGTDKTALIYSMDIRCGYRLVNPDNNRVVAVFTGAGHGGIARILGAGSLPVNYDAKVIVSDMFNSLASNVRHVLLVRRAEYIKNNINAKKINIKAK